MHTVYIERIDHDLNDRLTDDLAHASWLKVVDKRMRLMRLFEELV